MVVKIVFSCSVVRAEDTGRYVSFWIFTCYILQLVTYPIRKLLCENTTFFVQTNANVHLLLCSHIPIHIILITHPVLSDEKFRKTTVKALHSFIFYISDDSDLRYYLHFSSTCYQLVSIPSFAASRIVSKLAVCTGNHNLLPKI